MPRKQVGVVVLFEGLSICTGHGLAAHEIAPMTRWNDDQAPVRFSTDSI